MKKQCIFCGGRVNSKEHAWPEWLIKFLKEHPNENVAIEGTREGRSSARIHGVNAAIRVKNVCRFKCNGGLMGQLEDEASPILSPMIYGTAMTLSSLHQLTIANWVTKCSMIFDSMKQPQKDMYYDFLDRSYFREHLIPTDSTNIWLGCYSGTGVRAFTDGKTLWGKQQGGISNVIKGHVQTMVFGRLAIQILSIKRLMNQPTARIRIEPERGPWPQTTLQIWPVDLRGVQWPPSLSFDDGPRDLETFSNRFNVKRGF